MKLGYQEDKLTPISEVDKIPENIEKLINLLGEWSRKGRTFGKTGTKIKNELRRHQDLHSLITHIDMSGTERVALMELKVNKVKRELFLKRTVMSRELEVLEKLRKTDLTGKVYGYLKSGYYTFIIREFVPGINYKYLDLTKVRTGTLVDIANNLGKKLRELHELDIGLESDVDFIIDIKNKQVYFIDFERCRLRIGIYDRRADLDKMHDIISDIREKSRGKVWDSFITGYGRGSFKKAIRSTDI